MTTTKTIECRTHGKMPALDIVHWIPQQGGTHKRVELEICSACDAQLHPVFEQAMRSIREAAPASEKE